MIGGFALVAVPAEYRVTGVKTFIVSNDGIVYQKDLGPDSLNIVKKMELYNPDSTWHPTNDEWPPSVASNVFRGRRIVGTCEQGVDVPFQSRCLRTSDDFYGVPSHPVIGRYAVVSDPQEMSLFNTDVYPRACDLLSLGIIHMADGAEHIKNQWSTTCG